MSLQLHPDCKRRLIEKTAEIIKDIRIKKGNSLDVHSCMPFFNLDSILPTRGQIRDMLEKYIGDMPMFTFIFETLRREVDGTLKYDGNAPSIPLTKMEGYGDAKAIAKRLVLELEALPHEYSVAIGFVNDFGKLFAKSVRDYQISDSIKLTTRDELAKQFPFERQSKSLLGLGSFEMDAAVSTYFQVKVNGVIPLIGTSSPMVQAVSLFKSFLGLGISLGLYKIDSSRDWYSPYLQPQFIIHRKVASGWEFEQGHKLDASFSETWKSLALNDPEGKVASDKEKTNWIKDRLGLIKAVFDSNKAASKIILD